MAIKVGFVSLGCPKNLVNTEEMIACLANKGYEIVAEDVDADVIVINTCAFIESAKQEAIDNILDIAWLKENHTLKGIVVTGCMAQRYRDEIFERMPEVDCVLGTGSYSEICEAVDKAYKRERFSAYGDINTSPINADRVISTPEYLAYLRISEGCDNRCTYCVIPYVRGKFRSRPMDEIVEEARGLAELGIKELVVVGQDTTRYGEDLYGTFCLDSLLSELSEIEGIKWIRILYCYPSRITPGLVKEIANNPKVVKYIDIPIQHINDGILRRMNRKDTSEDIRNAVRSLREACPEITIRTTVITGFPGETEEEFEELKEYIKETKFERLGVFAYSREEGTPAYNMPDQIPEKVKRRRYEELMREQKKIHAAYNKAMIGKRIEVLCEGYDAPSGSYYGRSEADAPDIDGRIFFTANRRLKDGEFVTVEITEVMDYDLVGKCI